MTKNIAQPLALILLLASLSGCDTQPEQPTAQTPAVVPSPAPQAGNGFSTVTRIEYVMQCMQEHGGQTYDNMYHCACAIDAIAEAMTADEYDQAVTFTNLFGMAGERGGLFRDPPQSEQLRKKLKEAKAQANENCFPKAAGRVQGEGGK